MNQLNDHRGCAHDRRKLMTARFTRGPSLSGVRRAEGVSADDRDICPTPDGPNASKPAVQPHRHCAGCGRWLPLTRDGRILVHDAGFSGEGAHRWPNQTKIESFQESGATSPSPSWLVSDGVHTLFSPGCGRVKPFPLPASVLGEGSPSWRGSGLDRPSGGVRHSRLASPWT